MNPVHSVSAYYIGLAAHLRVLEQRIKDAKRRSPHKTSKEVEQMPELRLFPYPVQKLIIRELESTRDMTEEEPEYIDPNNVRYDCLFYRKYLLPFFLSDMTYDILTRERWQDFAFMFEDSGYEIYEVEVASIWKMVSAKRSCPR
ncbi:hypothetical protein POJ06DRAFT_292209 [Lipomyces tetrasporus]|uniref:Uncharacterized protein n=1 Tax=Lipomyces tetrasporus TaxID=54092 RepID=A0AAD7QNE2_9ASCO|nr:uncharacterized protein POJ06DRAFT_292209 [Lipomyces tetrasporus]KAJ8098592.1 hypothetical protein POJ06DRAFT_292209 [Lipomyces tetrasporus]